MSDNDNQYFSDNFNTKLDTNNELRFQNWIKEGQAKYNVDLSRDLETYDLRGFWKNGGFKDEAFRSRKGHAPDTYKKPNHPTFSNESIYHNTPSDKGGMWMGGEWGREGNQDAFTPSTNMLQTTHPINFLTNFFAKYEKGVKLKIPSVIQRPSPTQSPQMPQIPIDITTNKP